MNSITLWHSNTQAIPCIQTYLTLDLLAEEWKGAGSFGRLRLFGCPFGSICLGISESFEILLQSLQHQRTHLSTQLNIYKNPVYCILSTFAGLLHTSTRSLGSTLDAGPSVPSVLQARAPRLWWSCTHQKVSKKLRALDCFWQRSTSEGILSKN